MEKKHIAYPDIPQFRELVNTIKYHYTYLGKDEQGEPIYDESLEKPVLTFTDTVKIHGSNLSIVLFKDGTIQYQSREMILDDHNDIYNFWHTMHPHEDKIRKWMTIWAEDDFKDHIAIYGEWCGKGINKKCAIQELDKRFILFGMRKDGSMYDRLPKDPEFPEIGIYNIMRFPSIYLSIDFNNPAASLDLLNEATLAVEKECPVAKYFGVSGTGEGIVWKATVERKVHSGEVMTFNYMFKTKGEKHSLKDPSDKVVDPLVVEMYKSCEDFVKRNLGANRLEQGISLIEAREKQISIQNIAEFLKWAIADLKKECYLEIQANGLDEKILNKEASKVAREYFINHLNNTI